MNFIANSARQKNINFTTYHIFPLQKTPPIFPLSVTGGRSPHPFNHLTSAPAAPIFLLPGEKVRPFFGGSRSFGGTMGRSKIKGPVVFAKRSFRGVCSVFPLFFPTKALEEKRWLFRRSRRLPGGIFV